MHGELAFWTGLQIDDMTEQFYSVKRHQSATPLVHKQLDVKFYKDTMKKLFHDSRLVDTNAL